MPPKKAVISNKQPFEVKQTVSQLSQRVIEDQGGQSVKVALRLRPMNNLEITRGDNSCIKINDKNSCQITQKNQQVTKNYRFNYVLSQKISQEELYQILSIDDFIESALSGYSVTIFAYGQTGSGKTYTMAGQQDKFNQEVFHSDDTDGIIPRAIKKLWKYAMSKKQKYSIKASFTEIYNQQIRDLLNPTSGVLHCRWNSANGFFVQDLVIVDCTSIDDLIAVLNEGVRNRKSGSHELNKDSSRSHSIMTIYLISETSSTNNRSVKKYGKISFVDLAGSQRLKQSKSQGDMVKQTGNINKSLFTLGKVIKALSDKKNKIPYIPYRDSKLTMLLMDSLGGTSKALMLACISSSSYYIDETLSTLNYATRTMNIKNRPVIQMEEKDQIIYGLMRQRDLLRLQNQYLTEQIQKISKKKINMPESIENKKILPPLDKGTKQPSSRPISLQKSSAKSKDQQNKKTLQKKNNQLEKNQSKYSNKNKNYNQTIEIQVSLNKVLQEYQFQMTRLKHEGQQLRNAREVAQKNYMIVLNDNNALQIKLENLEQLFIRNSNGRQNINQQYMNNNLIAENKMIKNKIQEMQDQIYSIKQQHTNKRFIKKNGYEIIQTKQNQITSKNLKDRLQFLKQRQNQLKNLIKKKKH